MNQIAKEKFKESYGIDLDDEKNKKLKDLTEQKPEKLEELVHLQTMTMKYVHDFPISIGDVFYALETETQIFHGNCPVCKGKKIVTVNSVTFKCPVCKNGEQSVCEVTHYTVRAYRISVINFAEASTVFWKPEPTLPSLQVVLRPHRKKHESSRMLSHKSVSVESLKEKIDPIKDWDYYRFLYNLYKDYSSLVRFAERLNKEEEMKLEKFNASENTLHKLKEWKTKNDYKQIE